MPQSILNDLEILISISIQLYLATSGFATWRLRR